MCKDTIMERRMGSSDIRAKWPYLFVQSRKCAFLPFNRQPSLSFNQSGVDIEKWRQTEKFEIWVRSDLTNVMSGVGFRKNGVGRGVWEVGFPIWCGVGNCDEWGVGG